MKNYAQKEFSWSGPVGSWLKQQSNLSPAELFVREAKEIRLSTKIPGPPFSAYEYAQAMGVTVQDVKGLLIDGLLKKAPTGNFVVQLKSEVDQSRKNFTLAHELAHSFYYNDLLQHSPCFRGNHAADPEEEALCNLGARELLMPREIFQQDLLRFRYKGLVTPITLIKLARLYEVSMQAVMVRTVSILKDVCCVLWERHGEMIRVGWIAPKRMAPLILCQNDHSSAELAISQTGMVTRMDSFYTPNGKGRAKRIKKTTCSLLLPKTNSILSVLNSRRQTTPPAVQKPKTREYWWQRF